MDEAGEGTQHKETTSVSQNPPEAADATPSDPHLAVVQDVADKPEGEGEGEGEGEEKHESDVAKHVGGSSSGSKIPDPDHPEQDPTTINEAQASDETQTLPADAGQGQLSGNVDTNSEENIAADIQKAAEIITESVPQHLYTRASTMAMNHREKNRVKTLLSIIESKWFSALISVAVILNGIQMGVEVDHSGPELDVVFTALDHIFTSIFTIEMSLKIYVYTFHYIVDSWNMLDFFTTWVSIIDLWILGPVLGSSGLSMFSALRILRVCRAVRLLRVLKSFKELWLVVKGVLDSSKTIAWVTVILTIVLYICAIFTTMLIGKSDKYPMHEDDGSNTDEWADVAVFNNYQYFGTIPRAMFTLTNLALLSDDWLIVSRAVWEKQPGMIVFFFIFFGITSLGLMNVVMGVIVDNVLAAGNNLSSEAKAEQVGEELELVKTALATMTTREYAGHLSAADLEKVWDSEEMLAITSRMSLPAETTAAEFFEYIDHHGNGKVQDEEVIVNLMRLLKSDTHQHLLENRCIQNQILREIRNKAGGAASPKAARIATQGPSRSQQALVEQVRLLRTEAVALRSEVRECLEGSPAGSVPQPVPPISEGSSEPYPEAAQALRMEILRQVHSQSRRQLRQIAEGIADQVASKLVGEHGASSVVSSPQRAPGSPATSNRNGAWVHQGSNQRGTPSHGHSAAPAGSSLAEAARSSQSIPHVASERPGAGHNPESPGHGAAVKEIPAGAAVSPAPAAPAGPTGPGLASGMQAPSPALQGAPPPNASQTPASASQETGAGPKAEGPPPKRSCEPAVCLER